MTALGLGRGLSVTLAICLLLLWPIGEFSGLSAQAGLDCGWRGGKGLSYLVEPMIQQDNLHLSRVRALAHQHVAWVGVAVHEAIDKDHFTVYLAQVARDLEEKSVGWALMGINTCLRNIYSGPSVWPLSRGRPGGPSGSDQSW